VENNSMLRGFLFKERVLLSAYKQEACAVRSYGSTYRRDKSRFASILHSSGTSLRLVFTCFFFSKRWSSYVHLHRHMVGPFQHVC